MVSHNRPEEQHEADAAADNRRVQRMNAIDQQPAEIRALIHEHGWTIVKAFLDIGVVKARHIEHLIATVRKGSCEIGKRTGALQLSPGYRPDEFVLVPKEPTREMVEAGLAVTAVWLGLEGSALTVNREKMRRRYRAMVLAAPKVVQQTT